MSFSTPLVIAVLLATGLDLDDYRPAKEGILALLGPATVALAVPLHQNRRALAANTAPAIGALVAGCVSTLVVAVVLARALALSRTVTASISVKSVTAPIAIELASLVNGNPAGPRRQSPRDSSREPPPGSRWGWRRCSPRSSLRCSSRSSCEEPWSTPGTCRDRRAT